MLLSHKTWILCCKFIRSRKPYSSVSVELSQFIFSSRLKDSSYKCSHIIKDSKILWLFKNCPHGLTWLPVLSQEPGYHTLTPSHYPPHNTTHTTHPHIPHHSMHTTHYSPHNHIPHTITLLTTQHTYHTPSHNPPHSTHTTHHHILTTHQEQTITQP